MSDWTLFTRVLGGIFLLFSVIGFIFYSANEEKYKEERKEGHIILIHSGLLAIAAAILLK